MHSNCVVPFKPNSPQQSANPKSKQKFFEVGFSGSVPHTHVDSFLETDTHVKNLKSNNHSKKKQGCHIEGQL
jgi:hypothetical protein